MKKKRIFLAIIPFLILLSCNHSSNNTDTLPQKENIPTISIPDFNPDSAFFFVKTQTDFGPRVPNSEAHKKCALFLQNQLEKYCDIVIAQPFRTRTYDNVIINCKNLIGSFNPENPRRILLAAHWDSRPFADHDLNPANREQPIDGANDGASGVGVLLEVARQLKMIKPKIGVDIIFFDAEDWGTRNNNNESGDWWCLGSQHWAKNPHISNYKADFGILLDMVGAHNATFLQEGTSTQYASRIVAKVWKIAYRLGHKNYFLNAPGHHITDDHLYVNKLAKIPMIDIIHLDETTNTGFTYTWHTLQDNISIIDKTTLHVVGTTLLEVVRNEQ
jgi:hypothetical protein